VVERMGLIDQMRQRSLDQRGVAWIRADGSRRADMPVTAFNGIGLVSKLEILRSDLVDVLYQATKDQHPHRGSQSERGRGPGNAERRNEPVCRSGDRLRWTPFGGAALGVRA
jgi:hypothetical protein